ncbi:MAG: hypothetical protein A3J51_00810 [Omnitrophica WOR_2 bacterium RIFCSPHIGHO2_02_FULL_45_21]|nr:MAG: hypothetical protein A3J51_00810 [Omnitrophica WOR_2 bacterium RIFCSPHIGHO2_02_FULL_45_21]
MSLRNKQGAVLVVSLWILIILVLLAVSAGRRVSIALKLLRYHLNRTQAFYLAQAGIERIRYEKTLDTNEYDSLNEAWSNKLNPEGQPYFKNFGLGTGKFKVCYEYYESKDREPEILYGMQDEQSKLNINKIIQDDGANLDNNARAAFVELLKILLACDDEEAKGLVDRFVDWIDKDREAYPAKNLPLDRLEELSMIEGFKPETANKLKDYVTIYGDGAININSAPKEILLALGLSEESAYDILSYRKGVDGKIATEDDRAIREINELNTESGMSEIFRGRTLSAEDAALINKLITTLKLTTKSLCYMIASYGRAGTVTKSIIITYRINPDKSFEQLYRYEE